ncbi:dTMP kinase [Salisaeta longa]|uniref:dTMP kinase n=1 Tax=Salisaeta longa TaxID=503170 RepID=UPI0003B5DFDC|nr:dTMP kinase [Salisaeta longa]
MLISFEGIDGSGKSTQVQRLVQRLQAEGHDPLVVREPGGTPISERIRTLLLDESSDIVPKAELLLFSAARAQLVEQRIRPALAAGRLVVCDRFYDSSTAYQGGGRALFDEDWLEDFHRHVTGGLTPHRTYWLALPPDAARARRAHTPDRMEAAANGFQARVAAAYERLAQRHPARIKRLDATRPPEALHKAIWRDVCALLAR